MKSITILLQGADFPDILVGKDKVSRTVAEAVAAFNVPGAGHEAQLIFVEDGEEPLPPETRLEALLPDEEASADVLVLKLHVSRCRKVDVSIHYNGERATHHFPPSATVGRVHHWAAKHFGLAPRDAAEHVLQIHGTANRPDRDVHVGVLTTAGVCAVAFDLVPRKRVEG
jgi:hypothetical protein